MQCTHLCTPALRIPVGMAHLHQSAQQVDLLYTVCYVNLELFTIWYLTDIVACVCELS